MFFNTDSLINIDGYNLVMLPSEFPILIPITLAISAIPPKLPFWMSGKITAVAVYLFDINKIIITANTEINPFILMRCIRYFHNIFILKIN